MCCTQPQFLIFKKIGEIKPSLFAKPGHHIFHVALENDV